MSAGKRHSGQLGMLMTHRHRRDSARWAIALSIALAATLCAALVGLGPIGAKADTIPTATFDTAIELYRSRLVEDIDKSIASVKKLRDNVSSGDVVAAKQAWIDARAGWERSEVFTSGFAPELDREIDAWPNGATGFHAIETKLFGTGRTDVESEVDALLHNLSDMAATARNITLTSQGLFDGLTRLAYEVGESKLDGGESYLSGTSIDDMRHNVDGIELAYSMIFAPAIESRDWDHHAQVLHLITELKTMLAERDLRKIDQERLRALSEELVLTLQMTAPAIALARPTLELQ
ncbi:EfeM/EfeO family lipoprotein [Bradyrhizobium sp. dw_78]|uniref:EfeM/EfeO family lipoprotein n=1 Tax=Bradyrhizobium sp. dw_78 TaxID=2719793 RepID=UPI001BD3597A|nr:EfeM/EfeO family lipoprotein [Bradyrhizobium sp. dw_78]